MNFSVLVIGDNPEELMTPWQEFEADCKETPYVRDIDVTDEAIEYCQRFGKEVDAKFISTGYGYPIVEEGTDPLANEQAKCGYVLVTPHGQFVKVIRRTNPNAKFDFYGHRSTWCDFFKLKNSHARTWSDKKGNLAVHSKSIANKVSAVVDEIGWCGQEGTSEDQWEALVKTKLSQADNDTMLTVFDCHK